VRLPLADLEFQHLDLHSSTVRQLGSPLAHTFRHQSMPSGIETKFKTLYTSLAQPLLSAHILGICWGIFCLLCNTCISESVSLTRGLTRCGWGWQILQCLWQSLVSNFLWCVKGELWYVWQLELWTFCWLSWLRRLQTSNPKSDSALLTEMHFGQRCQYTLATACDNSCTKRCRCIETSYLSHDARAAGVKSSGTYCWQRRDRASL